MRGESVSAYSVNVGPSLSRLDRSGLQCDKWPVLPGAGADNPRASCVMSDSCPGDEQISARGKIPESRTKRLNGSLCEKRDIIVAE